MIFEKIRELRENSELTQRDIAKILNVSKSTYNRWETGEAFIPLHHLNKLCIYYNVNMDYIIGISSCKNENYYSLQLDKVIIGTRLSIFRKKEKLSQSSLAKILNTSHSTISAYEHGKTLLLTVFAYQIATQFNISLDWLCGRNEKKNR
ncbi:MAG: helix-turn-helix transcriptional regulator [Bacilli bacterium]|nr:helix-turn-helix transcriptional regulator [Bacilli bacterium]